MRHYSIETTTEPENVDLVDELKDHLSLNNGTAEDTLLQRFLNTARDLFEHETDGRIVTATTFTQYFPNWYNNHPLRVYGLELVRGKVLSVSHVKYYDENDTLQTLSDYSTDLTGTPALVYNSTNTYPTLSAKRPRPIQVQYVCGFGAGIGYVPDDVVLALLELAGHLYANRESHTDESLNEKPEGFLRICHKYKTGLGGL